MDASDLVFATADEHRAWLEQQARLPRGFSVGTASFAFTPVEVPLPARMTLSLIVCDRPTSDFAAVFTRNAFPGAPVRIGRERLHEPDLAAVVVNNKISNVCANDGIAAAERICATTAHLLGFTARQVLPASTGVIGWRLPVADMEAALPEAVATLQDRSALPAANGIMTTDLYPKVRGVDLPGGGRVVGIAKGAGMIEPNLATMLVYILTDCAIGREQLREQLRAAVAESFNAISIDSDQSTSDSVVAIASGRCPCPDQAAFAAALGRVCRQLAGDVVRNGEGVHHVIRCTVTGAPDTACARGTAKAVINSPLVKTAIAGNDPNVGRLIMAVGKHLGDHHGELEPTRCSIRLGPETVFADGTFRFDSGTDARLQAYLGAAQLYQSASPGTDGVFRPPISHPPHERCVEIAVDLDAGPARFTALGGDLTHEYISENADYRS